MMELQSILSCETKLMISKTYQDWLKPLTDEFPTYQHQDKELRRALYILFLLSQNPNIWVTSDTK